MSSEILFPQTTKICPTCGTRLGINAPLLGVRQHAGSGRGCGFRQTAVGGRASQHVTLSLPVMFGLAIMLLAVGAGQSMPSYKPERR